jgi:hypothetical protein
MTPASSTRTFDHALARPPPSRGKANCTQAIIILLFARERSYVRHQNSTCRPLHAEQPPAFATAEPLWRRISARTSMWGGRQPQDRQGNRPDDPGVVPRPRRRGDRIAVPFSAVREPLSSPHRMRRLPANGSAYSEANSPHRRQRRAVDDVKFVIGYLVGAVNSSRPIVSIRRTSALAARSRAVLPRLSRARGSAP